MLQQRHLHSGHRAGSGYRSWLGAHLAGLRRLASGSFTTHDCLDLRSLRSEKTRETIEAALFPLDAAAAQAPAAVFGPNIALKIGHGMPIAGPETTAPTLRLYDRHGRLAALAKPVEAQTCRWHPHRVFGGDV